MNLVDKHLNCVNADRLYEKMWRNGNDRSNIGCHRLRLARVNDGNRGAVAMANQDGFINVVVTEQLIQFNGRCQMKEVWREWSAERA